MSAIFPSGVKNFTPKTDGVDKIYAAHINDIQDEVMAIETELTKTTGSVVDHGALTGLGDNDHPQYLLASAKAADSDKLDGLDSSAFAPATHNHVGLYTTLVNPIVSASWTGGPFSSTPKTLIDLSAVFEGVPAGIKAVYIKAVIKDSDSANTDCKLILSPNNVNNSGISFNALPINDKEFSMYLIVPCNPDGDIYYQIFASGNLTFAAWLSVWGWWI